MHVRMQTYDLFIGATPILHSRTSTSSTVRGIFVCDLLDLVTCEQGIALTRGFDSSSIPYFHGREDSEKLSPQLLLGSSR